MTKGWKRALKIVLAAAGILLVGLIVVMILLVRFPLGEADVMEEPTAELGAEIAPTPSPMPPLEFVDSGTPIPERSSAPAQVTVDYPGVLRPSSSDVMQLTVFIPAELVSLDFAVYERVAIDPDNRLITDALDSYTALLRATDSMIATATSDDFVVSRSFPPSDAEALLPFALDRDSVPIRWAWRIKAPDNEINGLLTLTVKSGDGQTLWVRDFQIRVQETELAEVSQPLTVTAPPQPESDGSSLGWIIAVIVVVGGAAGGFFYLRRGDGVPIPGFSQANREEGQLMQRVHQALLDAFDRPAFERMLDFDMGLELEEISHAGSLTADVFAVVKMAAREDKLPQLVKAAHENNPSNQSLQKLHEELSGTAG